MLAPHSKSHRFWKNPLSRLCRETSTFVQDAPHHENVFKSDAFLIRCLKRLLPANDYSIIEPDLVNFGHRVRSDIWLLGQQCEAELPRLQPKSAWGHQGHDLITSPAWQAQKAVAAEEGLVAIPYEKKHGQFSRIYQVTKLMLYAPASGLYSCPLAMTDGAATTLLTCNPLPEVKEAFENLTSRNPKTFWTSGQWMTEKRGGSDVSQATETTAIPTEENPGLSFELFGYKWFSSATDSDMSLVLARRDAGLDLFLVRTRDRMTNQLNGIRIEKMKNKLGTRQLPTAELTLNGTKAILLSQEGRGVAQIASMLNITRLHNVISSVAIQRKMVNLARDYSQRRRAFGKRIAQHPLHLSTLSQIEVDVRGCTVLLMDLARQQGLLDAHMIGDSDRLLLRLMMPVAKMFCGKKVVANASECIECFGGQGYIEDTGIPGFLRDAQVLPIWEGTSNIMALDALRALSKSKGEVLRAFKSRVDSIMDQSAKCNDTCITSSSQHVKTALLGLIDFASQNQHDPVIMEIAARDFCFSLANIYIAALLIEHALYGQNILDAKVALQWVLTKNICPVATIHKANGYQLQRHSNDMQNLVFENYDEEDALLIQ